jgi:phosphohistidine phosphatase
MVFTMVNLVIMRHGEAEPLSSQDSQRQLTAKGRADVTRMAQWAATSYQPFDYIIHSPFIRTQQTAELMWQVQSTKPMLQTLAELVPEGDCQQVQLYVDALLETNTNARVLLVSHMPLVSFLVETFSKTGQTPIFETSGLVGIEYQPGQRGMVLEKMSIADLPAVTSAF